MATEAETKHYVVNKVLRRLGATPESSSSNDNINYAAVADAYDTGVREVMRIFPWPSLITRVKLLDDENMVDVAGIAANTRPVTDITYRVDLTHDDSTIPENTLIWDSGGNTYDIVATASLTAFYQWWSVTRGIDDDEVMTVVGTYNSIALVAMWFSDSSTLHIIDAIGDDLTVTGPQIGAALSISAIYTFATVEGTPDSYDFNTEIVRILNINDMEGTTFLYEGTYLYFTPEMDGETPSAPTDHDLRYIGFVTDYTKWEPALLKIIVLNLAYTCAFEVKGDLNLYAALYQEYFTTIQNAALTFAQEVRDSVSEWITAALEQSIALFQNKAITEG